ncbi:hypothetical protein IWQ61_002429 [Dispira simplex]|nr:hypothetical protein IWQ61_002429 [Dispira simplex]
MVFGYQHQPVSTSADGEQLPILRRPWYKRKRFWVSLVAFLLVALLVILLVIFVGFPKIAQNTVDDATMRFRTIQIHTPKNDSLGLDLDILLENTGSRTATLKFVDPVKVEWQDRELGTMEMDPITVEDGSGETTQSKEFRITDTSYFSEFVAALLAEEELSWVIKGNLKVKAGSIEKGGIDLWKEVKFAGMGGLRDNKIMAFDLPGDDPEGGIKLQLQTNLTNNSPIGVNLGHLRLGMYYQDTFVGPVESTNATLVYGGTIMNLSGRMIPQENSTDLEHVSDLMSKVMSGESVILMAKGVSSYPDGQNPVGWLSPVISHMQLAVNMKLPQKIELIQEISIGDMSLAFTPETAYSPAMSSERVTAGVHLPFNFSLGIQELGQSLNITSDGHTLAHIEVPQAPIVQNLTSDGSLVFSIPSTNLSVSDQLHEGFDQFVQVIAMGDQVPFGLQGKTTIKAQTPLGLIMLADLPFDVNTTMSGMRGLDSTPLRIQGMDVTDGSADQGLQLDIKSAITNPSNILIETGDVQFQLRYQDTAVGTVAIPDFKLNPNVTEVTARAQFKPDDSDAGKAMLDKFLAGEAADVVIAYYDGLSEVESLNNGLAGLQMHTSIPGLNVDFITKTRLSIPDDITQTGVARGGFTIVDPFSAQLSITKVHAQISTMDTVLGEMSADVSQSPLAIQGRSSADSPDLPVKLDLSKEHLLALLQANAKKAGVDAAPLEQLMQLAQKATSNEGKSALQAALQSSAVQGFLGQAMSQFTVDLDVTVDVLIGEYATTLILTEKDVPCQVDESLANLVPILLSSPPGGS